VEIGVLRRASERTRKFRESKVKLIFSPVKRCRVSFKDSEGVEHEVELEARTLYEAVGRRGWNIGADQIMTTPRPQMEAQKG
jgi:transcription antitermination factor NusA-like protein